MTRLQMDGDRLLCSLPLWFPPCCIHGSGFNFPQITPPETSRKFDIHISFLSLSLNFFFFLRIVSAFDNPLPFHLSLGRKLTWMTSMPLPAGSPVTPWGTPPAFRSHEFHPHFLHIIFNKIQKAECELEVKYKTAKCQVKSFRKRNPKTNLSFMFMQK